MSPTELAEAINPPDNSDRSLDVVLNQLYLAMQGGGPNTFARKILAAAVLAERERCAKIVETTKDRDYGNHDWCGACFEIVNQIRSGQ